MGAELLFLLVPVAIVGPVLLAAWADGDGDSKCHRCGNKCEYVEPYHRYIWCQTCNDDRVEWDGTSWHHRKWTGNRDA